MATPPFPTHQRIASNIERLLNDALEVHAPHLAAYQRIGIELPQFPHYRPEPDVAVVDGGLPPEQRHFDRFYLVAEVVSDSDHERIDSKREFYRAHAPNRAILLIRQDRQEIELDRRAEGGWRTEMLRGPAAELHLPDFGLTLPGERPL